MPRVLRIITHPSLGTHAEEGAEGAHKHMLAEDLEQAISGRFAELQRLGGIDTEDPGIAAKLYLGLLHSIALHHTVMREPAPRLK